MQYEPGELQRRWFTVLCTATVLFIKHYSDWLKNCVCWGLLIIIINPHGASVNIHGSRATSVMDWRGSMIYDSRALWIRIITLFIDYILKNNEHVMDVCAVTKVPDEVHMVTSSLTPLTLNSFFLLHRCHGDVIRYLRHHLSWQWWTSRCFTQRWELIIWYRLLL